MSDQPQKPEMFMLPLTEQTEGAETSLIELRLKTVYNDEKDTGTVVIGGFDRNGTEFIITVKARQGVTLDLEALRAVGERLHEIVRFSIEREVARS